MRKLLKHQIILFKKAVVEGGEKAREKEKELRQALAELLDTEDINYLIASFKRSAELEKAYQKRCEELREVRELISKAYNILY
jgi:hypothetical protein